MRRRGLFVVLAVVVVWPPACASSRRDLEPGDYWPPGQRWKRAASRALKDRGTWIPLAGAAAIGIGGWDREISDWAVKSAPVFGSSEHARDASDPLWLANQVSMVGTALAVPHRPQAWQWKHERLLIEEFAVVLTDGVTGALKDVTDRQRPDGSDTSSFPSGHASQAFTMARLAGLNVDALPGLTRTWRISLKTTFTTLAAATAWSRVEGGKHYPSDVLVGAALGNFIAVFVHGTFLDPDSTTRISATLSRRELSLSIALTF